MLNADPPVEGSYVKHLINELDDDSGFDSDDSISNAHENVRRDFWSSSG